MPEQMTMEETPEIKTPKQMKTEELWKVTENPSQLLKRLLKKSGKHVQRSKVLLTDPEKDGDSTWYMYLPKTFYPALDIRLTERMIGGSKKMVWTQGFGFDFQTGDTLYNTPKAYYSPWCEAIKHVKLCIHIDKATSALSPANEEEYYPGFVSFTLLTPDHLHSRLREVHTLEMTQGEFIQFLISGPSDQIQSLVDLPDPTGRTDIVDIRFTVKEGPEGTPWIMLEPLGKGAPLLTESTIGFNLSPGTSIQEAQDLCKTFESRVKSLSHTMFEIPSSDRDKWEFYQDKRCEWRWRRIASNGRIVGASSEGYKTQESCVGNAQRNGYKEHIC